MFSVLKRADIFGMPVSSLFNVNEKDQKHRTVPGGAFTVLLYTVILIFTIYKLTHLFGASRDSERHAEIQTNLEDYLLPFTKQIRALDFKSQVFMVMRGNDPSKDSSTSPSVLNPNSENVKSIISLTGTSPCKKDYIGGFKIEDHLICTDIVYQPGLVTINDQ